MSITISGIADNSTHLSGNIIEVKATTSGKPAGASEYRIMLKIESTDNVLEGSPFFDAITPDANGLAIFDISGLMDQHIQKDFYWPIPNTWEGRWHGYTNLVYDVRLTPGEVYIDENNLLVENWGSLFGTIFIVKGKLDNYFLAKLQQQNLSWFDYFCAGGRWFTHQPLIQYITPNQPVKLWWKPPQTGLSFALNAKAYYSDNSELVFSGSPTMWYDVMFEFDLQPDGLGFFPVINDAKLLYYEVWMTGSPNVEKRTFIIDHRYQEETYFLLADNQIGGIDCISLTGATEYSTTSERNIAIKPFQKTMGVKHRTKLPTGIKRERQWKINSGYKSKQEMIALEMLLHTPAAWLLVPPANGSTNIADYTVVPVNITSSSLTLTNSLTDQESVEIEFTEAY